MMMFEQLSPDLIQRARRIKLLILDVDGVLTTGQLWISGSGEVIKPFNTLDGHGIKLLQNTGVQTAIITARNDPAVAIRVEQLGITHYFKGVHDKYTAYQSLLKQSQLSESECAFVGDDVIDLPVLLHCGLPISVANAHEFVKQHTVYITQKSGGMGAVREVCDFIMHTQGTLHKSLEQYLVKKNKIK